MRPPGGLRCAAPGPFRPSGVRPAMGSCVAKEIFTSAHKEQPMVGPPPDSPPIAPQETHRPPVPPEKDNDEKRFQGSGSILSCADSSGNPSAYHVTALATSSLVGLVQTVKDHITKPTAMARGRVAHLIEWKGWSAPRAGWERALADEECYDELPDELKEARFAAGVAEQFAITGAMLSAWSSLNEDELGYGVGLSQEAVPLQDLGSLYLQGNYLLSSRGVSSTPTLGGSFPTFSQSSHGSLVPSGHSVAKPCNALQDGLEQPPPGAMREEQESAPGSLWLQRSTTSSLRYVDSSSLSEDEVFYN